MISKEANIMKLSTNAKIGIVSSLAIMILAAMIIWKGDLFIKSSGYELIGSFNNAGGLMPGAEVRYRGYKVGKVMRIAPDPTEVKVYIVIQRDTKVPEGSTLRVAFDGLIGQKFVEIIPFPSQVMLKAGSTLSGFSTLGIVDFIDVGTQSLEETKQILQSIRKITDDPIIQKGARQSLMNIEKTTAELNRITTGLSKAMQKGGFEDLLKSLSGASETITLVSKRLDSIITSLDKLTSDKEFMSDIKDTVKNAKDAFDEFKKASTDASKVLKRYSK
jgi:phospholipid/cholesterol/gamma-HCH transport system substrate-binding protein